MIRQVKHIGRDYIIVDNTLEVNNVKVPFHLQVNISNLTQEEKNAIFRTVSIGFDRHINFNKKSSSKKPWWKFW
jgi:hypothetical protein